MQARDLIHGIRINRPHEPLEVPMMMDAVIGHFVATATFADPDGKRWKIRLERLDD